MLGGQEVEHVKGALPEIDLSAGCPMGIQGWFLLALSLLVVAELIVLAALGSRQLLCQEDDSIMVDAQEPCPTHSTKGEMSEPGMPTGLLHLLNQSSPRPL